MYCEKDRLKVAAVCATYEMDEQSMSKGKTQKAYFSKTGAKLRAVPT